MMDLNTSSAVAFCSETPTEMIQDALGVTAEVIHNVSCKFALLILFPGSTIIEIGGLLPQLRSMFSKRRLGSKFVGES
jgi:hypothetical protein